MSSLRAKKEENHKGTAYFWKSTSLEPQISSLSLRHGISKVALGNEHTIILTYNSEVFAVGENFYGQLGFGDVARRSQTTRVSELAEKNIVDIACGAYHSAAVCDNGELFCWGDSSNGQCGIGDIKSTNVPTLVVFGPNGPVLSRPRSRAVESEDAKILAGKLSSSVGSQSIDQYVPKIRHVACGEGHTLALTSSGVVWSWGVGCQTGHGMQNECIREPREVEGLKGRYVTAIRCGTYHSIALVKNTSIQPKLIPQRNEKLLQGSSGKKRSKRLRRFSRSKESTKGLKKTQSLLENPELSPKGPTCTSEVRRIHVNTSPKTYLSYDPVVDDLGIQNKTSVSDETLQVSGLAETQELTNTSTCDKRDLSNEQIELDTFTHKDESSKKDDQKIDVNIEASSQNFEMKEYIEESNSDIIVNDGKDLLEGPATSNTGVLSDSATGVDDILTSVKTEQEGTTMLSGDAMTVDSTASTHVSVHPTTSDKAVTSGVPQSASPSIPINPLSIHENRFGFPEMKQPRYAYLEGSSPEPSPPQPGFLNQKHFNHVTNDLFMTTDVSGSLCETSALFESVDPGSLTSIKSGGTDSDPEEVSPTTEDKNIPASSYLGFGILASRFRQEMDLGKLTSAVYDSVTGMFMSSASAFIPTQSDKSLTQGESCSNCGVLGICICNEEVTEKEKKFNHEGYDTEVWTWGRGGCGQLGHGDTDDKSIPYCVDGLRGTGVIKIAAGTFHSLALAVYCQVFSWGDNSCGQLGHKKAMAVKPKKVKCFSDVLIWDIACGSHYSLFIGDMALNRPDVYVCGRQPSEMPVIAAALNKMQETSSSIPLSKDDIAVKPVIKSRPPLTHSRSFDDVKERSFGTIRVELVRLIMFRKVGSVRCVLAQNEHCCCIADSDATGVLDILGELSSEERLFYYQLALIWQAVLVPVIQSELWSIMVPQESGMVLVPVVQGYLQLMKCVSSSMVSVTQVIQDVESMEKLFDTCLSEEFITAFERYSEVYNNAVAYGVFMLITSLASDVGPQCKAVLRDLLEDADKDFIGFIDAFQWVARVPLIRMQHYVTLTSKLLTLLPQEDPQYSKLVHITSMWKTLTWQDEKRYLVAEQTRQFWEDCPSKITETFKVPNRRLLRSSKTHPLYPSKSARFSSPMYVLFDDYFVHIQSHKNYQALPLNTLWAVSMENSESLINAIKIISPEETLLVCAPCAEDKGDWLLTINQAVARVISKTTAYRLGKEAVNVTTGNLPAATAREAIYTFTQDARYKAATYSGMWLNGKLHGRGEMSWTDGRRYTGEFNQGLHDGEGVMVFPVNPENPAERYEGQWIGGKMTGFGKMRYTNGDTYTGHWVDNMRHGHGTMKCGALSSSAASVYIGEWLYNKRHGYGTLDDVLKGEKYMGMWENDYRHGPGIIVTLEGIYTQGNFIQNKLMGAAQLVCDDNTYFDGEFAGHCQLAGKGTLTLPNGDVIDGTFTGQWGDGIKISGTYMKRESDSNSKSKSAVPEVKPVVSPDRKWTALFRQCREALGCPGDRDADPQTVWKCISMGLLNGPHVKLPRTEQDIMQELLNVNNEMERTGSHSLDNKALQNYLAKAFEISYHPLGQLVTNLVDVYRATYVGMGTHRRLLPHAVTEAKSIIHRLYTIIRLLFIELPNEEYVHLDKDSLGGVSNIHTEMSTSSTALLHPIVLPLLYPPLFTLYALHNERADSLYWERLLQLNWRSDLALMTYVGVKRQFWLASEEESVNYDDEVMGENREAHHYVTAIEALQQISTKLSPMEKLAVLKTTFEKINEEVHTFWKGEEKLISLDDLFPVFQFVTIRSRIPHLGSEIHFIDDMVDSHVHVGEQGHMFTTLKACFFQIQNEKG